LQIYGTEISRDTISRITDAIVDDMVTWQNRPLDRGRFLSVVANHGL
jgi:transposase-like protein